MYVPLGSCIRCAHKNHYLVRLVRNPDLPDQCTSCHSTRTVGHIDTISRLLNVLNRKLESQVCIHSNHRHVNEVELENMHTHFTARNRVALLRLRH